MNIGLYQSASALSALERWQDSVSQNITSSQTSGFRKRTINFSTESAGELHTELEDGRRFVLKPGMSYQVADNAEPHRSHTSLGATLFIVD